MQARSMGHARDPSSRARGEEGRGRKSTRVHTHTNTACVWHTAAMTLYTIALDGETSSNTVKTLLCEFQRHHVLESSRAGRGGGTNSVRTHSRPRPHAQTRTNTHSHKHKHTLTHAHALTHKHMANTDRCHRGTALCRKPRTAA